MTGMHEHSSIHRRLATLGDAIDAALTSSPCAGPTFGLPGLDLAAGRLQAGSPSWQCLRRLAEVR
ncbi:hypothetical protein GCM10022295_93570 [Streptomyces osmaniensis]|uniref:Uncharacterized protein n=1 Tax=Streptomyces osmaniensis TaxID=593134 RepID=A0ABP6Z8E2_9ACTN